MQVLLTKEQTKVKTKEPYILLSPPAATDFPRLPNLLLSTIVAPFDLRTHHHTIFTQTQNINRTTLKPQRLMDPKIRYPHGVEGKDIVRSDTMGVVARLDAVIKFSSVAEQQQFIENEKCVYERLGHHDRILRYYGNLGDNIILQYDCHGSIGEYLARQAEPPTTSVRVGWMEQITEAVAFAHSKNVLHGNICLKNMLTTRDIHA